MNKRRIQIFDADEWNAILKRAYACTTMRDGRVDDYCYSLENNSFLKVALKNVELTTKWGLNMLPTTYYFTLDGTVKAMDTGSECYSLWRRAGTYYDENGKKGNYFPNMRDDPVLAKHVGFKIVKGEKTSFANTLAGYLYSNPKYEDGKKHHCYIYDLNSAYLAQVKDRMPDTRAYKAFSRKVAKGEVGFLFDNNLTLVDREGLYADVIFDEIETPDQIKRFANDWYERRKDPEFKAKAKRVPCLGIGYMQWTNPYIRSYVICKCNRFIKRLQDENTILCNTDAIFSACPLELKIGSGLGEFKFEENDIILSGMNYSLNDKDVTRGKFGDLLYRIDEKGYIYDV